ncbi:tryptophan--tRNA ligase [Candidatus Saccharibacteria bacterium]|nr:tryptophan--tRNA ligase [Candidatus Saccharibacteria bacterium]
MSKPVILTGLRANSEFHLGNYLGAILPMVELQAKHAGQYQLNMFIPDLHSLTTPIDHGQLYQQTLDNLKLFVAAGLKIDNPDTFIYRQSYVPAHSELAWILGCFTYFGELSRMTQFKEKSQDQDSVSSALFSYPVLMAADILLYGAQYVPVGEDQRQHLELARDLAMRINHKFGKLFVIPEDWEKQLAFSHRENVRIRSLRTPEKKMSKSITDPAGTILLSDKPETAAKKIMGATTDSVGAIHLDWDKQPGVSNLLQILALLSHRSLDDVKNECDGKTNYTHLKQHVADHVRDLLKDVQARLLKVDEQKLLTELEANEKVLREVANRKLRQVQKAVGLRP